MSQLRYNFQTGQMEPLPEYLTNPNYTQDFDDYYTSEDYDRRQAEKDGWTSSVWDGRWFSPLSNTNSCRMSIN